MADEPDIVARTFDFACRIVRFCGSIRDNSIPMRSLVSQLIRSGTSIGSNVEEAQAGQSKADFVSKYSIALKEARETNYWLRLMRATDLCTQKDIHALIQESEIIKKIIGKIVVNAKKNA